MPMRHAAVAPRPVTPGLGRRAPTRSVRRVVIALLLLGFGTAAAQPSPDTVAQPDPDAKRLFWPSVSVRARLDADGRLHVVERQVMSLTGDWNGGERRFADRFGQSITLESMVRIDATTGASVPLVEGPLDRVDEYRWVDGGRLRWRSRLPEDPPFRRDTRTYELRMVYDYILQRRDGGWVLDHDFAFADRAEPIDTFALTLEVDPAWRLAEGQATTRRVSPLAPGEGFVVTLPLQRIATGAPGSVYTGASAIARWAILALLWGGLAWLVAGWVVSERRSTRWAPMPLPPVTPEWLRANVLALAPEVAGAMWDDRTSAPEVAAVLARLVAEGKLRSTVRREKVLFFTRQVLELEMPKGRGVFRGHDRALVEALFASGETRTDTDAVRKRYARSGFDPASTISFGISEIVTRIAPDPRPSSERSWQVPTLLALSGIALVSVGIWQRGWDAPAMAVSLVPIVLLLTVGTILAKAYQREVLWLALGAVPLASLILLPTIAFTWQLLDPVTPFGALTQAGIVLVWLFAVRVVLRMAAPVQSPKRIAQRRRLAHARRWFRSELAKPSPALEDAWFPWLIAFGLGPAVDKWFRAFGGAVASAGVARMASSSGASGTTSGGGGSGWTGFGGGGGFAGGGSSASFATAVGGMAASVPKPGSSSGGGSGGGGSSGGGGGGGW